MKIASLENKVGNDVMSYEVRKLSFLLYNASQPFLMGYCASDDITFDAVADYVKEQLGINSVRSVEFDPSKLDLCDYFRSNLDLLNGEEGDVILIKVNGFEKHRAFAASLFKDNPRALEQEAYSIRVAHDYDQNLIENNGWGGLNKKIVVLTHIDNS